MTWLLRHHIRHCVKNSIQVAPVVALVDVSVPGIRLRMALFLPAAPVTFDRCVPRHRGRSHYHGFAFLQSS